MTAIIYTRFSTIEQGKGGSDSIARQMKACEPYCLAKAWEVENVLQDSGKSAFKGTHRFAGALGEFEREALDGLHVGKVLVVESLDRLSRQDHTATSDLIRSFQRCGVGVATVEGDRLYEGYGTIPFEEMIELIVRARMNHEASETKARHGRSKWAARRERAVNQKTVITSLCPSWLEPNADRTGFNIIGEGKGDKIDRGVIVAQIFQWADEGWGSLRIIRKLNETGVPTWPRFENRTARAWQRSFILKLLQDVSVTGDYQPMKYDEDRKRVPACDPIRAYYPRIVPPDVFQRVSAAAVDRKGVRGNRSGVLVNLVSGLAVCHQCGGKMVYRQARAAGYVRVRDGVAQAPTKRPLASLVCETGEARGCSNRAYSSYTSLEKALVSDALHLALDDRAFARRDEVARIDVKLADLKRDHEIAYAKAIELWQSAGASEIARKLATANEAEAATIKEEIAALEQVRIKASGQATAAEHLSRLQHIRDNLLHEDLEVRAKHRQKVAQGFRSVISKVVCYPGRFDVHFHGSIRFMMIRVERGRRQPTISHLNLDRRDRDHPHDTPAVAALRTRARADKNPAVFGDSEAA